MKNYQNFKNEGKITEIVSNKKLGTTTTKIIIAIAIAVLGLSIYAYNFSTSKGERYWAKGETYNSQGNFKEAEKWFVKAAKEGTNIGLLGDIYYT